jgi:hypothetical protein
LGGGCEKMVTRMETEQATVINVPAHTTVYEMLDEMGHALLTVIVNQPCREALIAGHLFQLEDDLQQHPPAVAGASPPPSLRRAHLQAL